MNAATTRAPAGDESALYRQLQPRLLGLLRSRVRGPAQTLAGSDERAGELRAAAIEALEALAALPERQRRLLAGKVAGYSYRELGQDGWA